MIRTTNFDAIATSAPLNREAAVVRDGAGETFESGQRTDLCGRQQWDAPPICRPMPKGVEDLTGQRKGRLVVVRYFGSVKGARWLVRCSCGTYEVRKSKALGRQQPDSETPDMCGRCQYVREGQKVYRAINTGRWPDGRPAEIAPGILTKSGLTRLKEVAP